MRVASIAVLLVACSSNATEGHAACADTESLVENACVPRLDDCGETGAPIPGGGCTPAGVPVDGCATGFAHDGAGGCTPIQPETPCEKGQIALLGATSCTPIVECGTDPYGSPSGTSISYVDASAADPGDGSLAKPFKNLGDAILAAKDGDTLALAAGTYPVHQLVRKKLTIWGRCPSMVSIVGDGGPTLAPLAFAGAGSELHRVGITGDGVGFVATDAKNVLVEDVWVHDLPGMGVAVQTESADASMTVRHSLIENVKDTGIGGFGADLTVESTVVRNVLANGDGDRGIAVDVEGNLPTKRTASLSMAGSMLTRAHEAGVLLLGVSATIDSSVITDIQPKVVDKSGGEGIVALYDSDLKRSSSLTITGSYIARTQGGAIAGNQATFTIARTFVTDVVASPARLNDGCGLIASDGSTADISQSTFANVQSVGLVLTGDSKVDRTIVRDIKPDKRNYGAVGIMSFPQSTKLPRVELVDTVVVRTKLAGVVFSGCEGVVRRCNIRATAANQGGFGDGLQIAAHPIDSGFHGSDVIAESTFFSGNERAGASALGDCALHFSGARFSCNGLDIAYGDAVSVMGSPGKTAVVDDLGNNVCGCDTFETCHAQASTLTPSPIDF
ncbi:MAG: hypothetical protein ACXVEE_09710 [Polyangiales bacterium]